MARGEDHRHWAALIRLTPESGLPLQLQIRQAIIRAIAEGKLPAGTRLASCRDLADGLGVARNTVVLAFQQLVGEGALEARPRSGYYVPRGVMPEPVPPPAPAPVPAAAAGAIDWRERLHKRPSQRRNIVKPADWQRHPYPFVYGQFDPSLFPTNDWRECARAVLSVIEIKGWAQDLVDGDDAQLIEQIRQHVLPRRGIWVGRDEIIPTLGAQHALYLIASLLSGPGVTVAFEDPGYPDARNIFETLGATICPVPVDAGGLIIGPEVEAADVVFVTPNNQCPTTATMPRERRAALLDTARRHDVLIVEDDYGIDLLGDAEAEPALKSADRDGRVVYVGSLSKILAPGLRLGYVVAAPEVVKELRVLRRLMLRHPPANNQRMVALFLSLGHARAHIERYSRALAQRRTLLMQALARHLPDWRVTPTATGSSLWVIAPPGIDTEALAAAALARGIVIEPGHVFFAGPDPPVNTLRLGYGSIVPERIEAGVRLLAEVARGAPPLARRQAPG